MSKAVQPNPIDVARDRYGPRAMKILQELAANCRRRRCQFEGPVEALDDDCRWELLIYRGDLERGIVASIILRVTSDGDAIGFDFDVLGTAGAGPKMNESMTAGWVATLDIPTLDARFGLMERIQIPSTAKRIAGALGLVEVPVARPPPPVVALVDQDRPVAKERSQTVRRVPFWNVVPAQP